MYYADDLLVVSPGDELQVRAEFQHTVHPLNPNQDVYLLDTATVTAVLMDGDTELVAATQLTYSGFNPDGSFWFQVREDGAGVRASFSIPDSVGSGTLHISISYTTLAGVERTMTTPVAVVDVDPPHAEVEVHLDYGTPDRVCIEELVLAGCMLAGPVPEYDCSCSYADLLGVYAAARAGTCRSRSRVRQQLLQHCSGSSTAGLEQTIVVNVTTFEPAERDLTVLEPVIFGDTGEVSAFASMQAIVHPAEPQEFFSGSLVIRMMVGSDTAEGELRMSSTAALTDRLGNTGDPGSLFIPPEMQFNIDTTSPTAEVASIEHDADGTVTLTLEATEAIVPPRIYLDGCVGQNCEFEAVALAGASLAEIFSDTHVYVYKKDDASPEGTWPLIFDAFTVGFDQASNRIGCSGGEQCTELTQPGQVSCFTTDGDPCELVIDMAAPELEGELSVATSNALDDLHVMVGDTVTIVFSVSEQLHPSSPVVELTHGEDGVGMQVTQAADCADPCLDYVASMTVEDDIFEGPAGIRLILTDIWGNAQMLLRGSRDTPIIVVDTTAPVVQVEPRTTKLYSVFKFNVDPDGSGQGLRDWDAANAVQLAEIALFGLDGEALHDGLTCTNPRGTNPTDAGPEDACDGFTHEAGQPIVSTSGAGHKWLDFNKGDLIMTFDEPVAVAAWDWQTANDARERDPTKWNLEGSNDGRTWTVLDSTPDEFLTSRDRFAWQGPFEIQSRADSLSSLLAGGGDIVSVVVTTSEPVRAISVTLTDADGNVVARTDDIPVEVPPYAVPTGTLSHAYFTHDESRQFVGFASAVLDFTGLEGVLNVFAVGIVDLVGNTGVDTEALKTVTVDTTPPVVSVSITASEGEDTVVAPTDGTSVTVYGDASSDDEPVTMPYVVVGGVPVATRPAEDASLSVPREQMLHAVFSWADVNMNGFLSHAESQQLLNVTSGRKIGARFDYAQFGRLAGQLRANANLGFTIADLDTLYDGAMWSNSLGTAYGVLIGYDELATVWFFEYTITKDDAAGELAVLVQHATDLNGNVGDDVTSAATPLTVRCADGYWGNGRPCARHKVCTANQHQTVEPSAVADRVCTNNTVCKTVSYYVTQAQLTTSAGAATKAVLASVLPTSVVTKVGAAYLNKIGGPDIAKLKALLANGKGEAAKTWLMSRPDLNADVAALSELQTALAALPLQYMTDAATPTEDTVCAPVTACDNAACEFELGPATTTTNTVCSLPCAGHGECNGQGSCTCWPTCSADDSSSCNADVFAVSRDARMDENCPEECSFEDWVGVRCKIPKVLGCTTFSAENFDRLANYDDPNEPCVYNPCKVQPCQRGGTCDVPDTAVNEFVCSCPAGYGGDRCERKIPRFTSPANSIIRGPNLAGAESGGIGLLELIPMDQFNVRRQYSGFAAASADVNTIAVTLSFAENTVTVLENDMSVLQQADGSFVFGITYSVENTGGTNVEVQLTVQSQRCVEKPSETGSKEADATACAAVTALSSDVACLAVRTAADVDQAACEYQPLFGGEALDLTIASGVGPASATTSEVAQVGTGSATAGQAAIFEILLVDAYGTSRSEACPDDCGASVGGCAHDCGTPDAATCTINSFGVVSGEGQDACNLASHDAMQSDCMAITRASGDDQEPICQYNEGLAVAAKQNLAFGQPTSQSSTSFGGSHARAVDGNADSDYGGNSCTHSDGNPAWWQVDLGTADTVVETVVVTHRSDCCQDRLVGAKIYVGTTALQASTDTPVAENGWVEFGVLANGDGGAETAKVAGSTISGRYVVVHMDPETSAGQHMTLCEVEVYGSAPGPDIVMQRGDSSGFESVAGGGSYRASWATETAGQYRLELSLHGDVLGCAADGTCNYGQAQTIIVESADTAAERSVVTTGGAEFTDTEVRLQAGSSLEFTVTTKDTYGNENEEGTKGGELTVGLKGGEVTVSHVAGGVYDVVAQVGSKRTYNLEVQIADVDFVDPP
eukprot:COSAG03_NODE_13_length_22557_cov_4.910054_3_plen_1965_part_01